MTLKMDIKKIQQKMRLAADLFNFAYTVKRHQLKKKHTDWTDQELHNKTIELIEKGSA